MGEQEAPGSVPIRTWELDWILTSAPSVMPPTHLQIQLIRIQRRVPEFGWTTQKVFHLMNFLVNGGN